MIKVEPVREHLREQISSEPLPLVHTSAYLGYLGDTSVTDLSGSICCKEFLFFQSTFQSVLLPSASREGHAIVYCKTSGISELS